MRLRLNEDRWWNLVLGGLCVVTLLQVSSTPMIRSAFGESGNTYRNNKACWAAVQLPPLFGDCFFDSNHDSDCMPLTTTGPNRCGSDAPANWAPGSCMTFLGQHCEFNANVPKPTTMYNSFCVGVIGLIDCGCSVGPLPPENNVNVNVNDCTGG